MKMLDNIDLDKGWTIIFEKDRCHKGHNMRVSMLPQTGDKKARLSLYCNCDFGIMQLNDFIPQIIHSIEGNSWDFVLKLSEVMGDKK